MSQSSNRSDYLISAISLSWKELRNVAVTCSGVKCLLQAEMRGHSHFEMLPAEGVLLFSAWTKLSLNTEHSGYFLTGPYQSPATCSTSQAHAISMLLWAVLGGNILHGCCWNFAISQKGKEAFLVPEHRSQSWDSLDFTWTSSRMCSSKNIETTPGQEPNQYSLLPAHLSYILHSFAE